MAMFVEYIIYYAYVWFCEKYSYNLIYLDFTDVIIHVCTHTSVNVIYEKIILLWRIF